MEQPFLKLKLQNRTQGPPLIQETQWTLVLTLVFWLATILIDFVLCEKVELKIWRSVTI